MGLRIVIDWGTSALRLWALDADGAVVAERRSDQGMGRLTSEGFEPALLALAGDLIAGTERVEVLICGMAGARGGWCEAPYLAVPCRPVGTGAVTVATQDPRLTVRILPGLSQAIPPDVMRGEETQIAGFLAARPDFDGVLCLPGTHTKWVRVEAGDVTRFHTVMTGELFALLSENSVLRLSMAAEDPWDAEAFVAAVDRSLAEPETLSSALFTLRAAALLTVTGKGQARAALSGLLLGHELAAMRALWAAHPVAIIGAPALSKLYQTALALCHVSAELCDGDTYVLDGLRAALKHFEEQQA